jgi:hypothetical protein
VVIAARAGVARALIRWTSRWIDASYAAWCRVDLGEVPGWYEKPWVWGARRVSRFAVPLAHKFDAEAAGAQMVEECWWG